MKFIKIKLDEKEPFYIKIIAYAFFATALVVLMAGLYITFHH